MKSLSLKRGVLVGGLGFLLGFVAQASAAPPPSGGGMEGGGGHMVVCRDSNNKILSAQLLDVFEIKSKFGLTPMTASGDISKDYIRGVTHGQFLHGDAQAPDVSKIQAKLDSFFKNQAQFIPAGQKLPDLNDVGEVVGIPLGCELEQGAICYDDKNIVEIDPEIWGALDSLNQAALVEHEITYQFDRARGSVDSRVARSFVSFEFADESNVIPGVMDGVPDQVGDKVGPVIVPYMQAPVGDLGTVQFNTEYYRFYEPNSRGTMLVQFTSLFGFQLLNRSFLTLNPADLVELPAVQNLNSMELIGWHVEIQRQQNGPLDLRFFDEENLYQGDLAISL